jgi:ABC-2 type transport system permease protein
MAQDLKRALEYQLDFFIQLIATAIMQTAGLLTIWGIFNQVQNINGWGYWEIIVVYALMYFAIGFGEIFFEGPWEINSLYLKGGMDYLITRPLPVVFQLFSSKIGLNGIGNMLTAVIVLLIAIPKCAGSISITSLIMFFLFFFIALPIKGAIILASNCITFWTKAPGNAFANLVHNIGEYTKYPITIYPRAIQFIVCFLFPYAFISFFPASILLQKEYNMIFIFLAPIVTVYSIFLSIKLFQKGLKLYESVGN